ncbi:methyltransferase family protein [Brevundimonas sp. UBA7664]|jgi:protein-S-isoprenylcysteine O-methyltransferase Ste14|uniref:methyltransferase family protein n=1 Tax=Brevundimonas sp. UBA7664 TaxID=1946141 RepID=UPI0025B99C04|nr:isoprenylcysteine carboxylmethyltransferase family protein [Brevundimonas sp. UBA7664]
MHQTVAPDLFRVQRIRKGVLLIGIVVAVGVAGVSRTIGGHTPFHEYLEDFGLAAITVCIVGRAWCSLYIGGRKKAEIVDRGPYSISRNPLYMFSFMGAFGIGARTGSIALACACLLIAVIVFRSTVSREERWLRATFGEIYAAYAARTPRFWPNVSRWRDPDVLEVRPGFFLTTLRDGLVFLLAVPVFESVEYAQTAGWVAALIRLP